MLVDRLLMNYWRFGRLQLLRGGVGHIFFAATGGQQQGVRVQPGAALHDDEAVRLLDQHAQQRYGRLHLVRLHRAIPAGIAVLELQQNSDATFRLYDYGRPRELHLDDGIAVSDIGSHAGHRSRGAAGPVDILLHNGPHFCLVRASSADVIGRRLSDRLRWVMPLKGTAWSEDENASAGECLLLRAGAPLSMSGSAVVLIAAEGSI